MPPKPRSRASRLARLLRSVVDPALWLHPFRMLHYYGYTHVAERRKIALGRDVRIAPNVSFAHGERILLGDQVQIGAHCALWAGRSTGRIEVGARTTFGPSCFITAADYGLHAGTRITDQPMTERDVIFGPDCWIGTKAVITAGITIGEGAVIGAGSVVTKDVPAGAIAAGVPAKVLKMRD
ncbi:acyltransferase [Roseivivax halodurans]|uniref:acyltransferase n=1 Tax=Roseivivax halodurans TaxID=93683 RepID=UPI0005680C1B|nr:acyltransferase [Roseivivax halodurans]